MPSTRATETMRFDPDYAVPPGETLREVIKALGMKQRELATRLEMAPKTVNQILQGRAPITPETALRLERVTRVRASFWNNREAIYQERSARLRQRASLEDDIQWLDEVPIGELVKRGQIAKGLDVASRLAAALTFFGVASVAAWKRLWESDAVPVELRSSTTRAIDVGALAAWIRIGELKAHAIDCEPYDRARFRLILDQVRGLAVPPPSESLLKARRLCAEAGVAFVVVPEIKGA